MGRENGTLHKIYYLYSTFSLLFEADDATMNLSLLQKETAAKEA